MDLLATNNEGNPLKRCDLAKHCQLWVSVFSAEKYEMVENVMGEN